MRDYFLIDLDPVIGTANAKENFAKMDEAFGASKFVKDDDFLRYIFQDTQQSRYWKEILQRTYDGEIDTWDYQWILSCLLQNVLTITPNINLHLKNHNL